MDLQPCVRLFKVLIFKTTVGISPQGYSEKQIKKKKKEEQKLEKKECINLPIHAHIRGSCRRNCDCGDKV